MIREFVRPITTPIVARKDAIVLVFGVAGVSMDFIIHFLVSGVTVQAATTLTGRIFSVFISPALGNYEVMGIPLIWIHMTAHLLFFSAFGYLITQAALNIKRKRAQERSLGKDWRGVA